MQYASAHHNLLVDPLIRVRRLGGAIDTLSLPELYASLAVDGVAVFPALRPHQRHAWHAFLAQLAVIAMHRGDATEFPETASEWRTLLRALTRAFAHDQPWHLVGGEPAQPAFMQCPAPRGLEPYRTLKATPDDLDLLITSKNHEQKRSIAVRSATDDWIFALIDVQTMSGFSGPGNYGVARMNGGLSSRPCLGFAPAGRGPGAHLVHDVRRMLAGRGALVERHAFAPDSGLALLWLHPWDGTDAVSLRMLDPYFIEVCRRVRLAAVGGRVVARTAAAKTSRIDSKAAHGDVGDFWAPVRAEDGKALSISAASFRYDRLTALLTDVRRAPALNVNTAESPRWRLVARGVAGGRGRTAGYHERTNLTFEAKTVEAWLGLGRGRSDALRQIAAAQMAEVREVLLALQFAVAVAKSGGRPTEELTAADRQRGYAWTRRLEDVADARFFPALESRFLARHDAEAARRRLEFVRGLISTAEDLLAEAVVVGPCSAIHRPRARAQAARAFRGRLRREESVFCDQPEVFAPSSPKPPSTVRAAWQLDLGRLVSEVAALAPASVAALRREPLAGIGPGLSRKLLAAHGPAGRVDSDRWAAVLRAIARLMPKTPPRNPHDRTRPFGAALFAAGVSELQLDRLLTAQGQRRRELITSACRRLAARRHTRLDLWPLVRWPRALIRSTQKPISGLWKVTRSTRPASTSRSGAVVALTCGPCRRWGTRSRLRGIVRADASEGTMSRPWPIVPERLVRSRWP